MPSAPARATEPLHPDEPPRLVEPTLPDPPPRSDAAVLAPPDRAERVLDVLAAVTALAFLAVIAAQAGAARFFTDECFHAHVARWIAEHGRLPRIIPEIYSGFAYTYPPLFHLIGAAVVRLAGIGGLPWLNPVLVAGLLALLVFAPPRGVDRAARRWALVICAGNAAVATYALRFYAEALLMLLAAAAAALFLRLRSGGIAAAAGLGVVVGLAIATKTSALALLVLPVAAAVVELVQNRRAAAGRAAFAALVAVLVAAPVLLRNQALFGSALYPAFAPDLDPALYGLHLERFGWPAGAFFMAALVTLGPALPLALAGVVVALARRRLPAIDDHAGAASWLLLFGLVAIVTAPILPVQEPRHMLPLLPMLALAGAVALAPILSTRARRLVDAGLLACAAVALASLPGLRARLDPPAPLLPAYAAVAAHVPEHGTVLSLWTYDTFYWSGRAATWPVPWGQTSRPLEPLLARDPAALVAALDRHGIDAVLAPLHSNAGNFDGSNYPREFLVTLAGAVEAGTLEVAWSSDRMALLVRRR